MFTGEQQTLKKGLPGQREREERVKLRERKDNAEEENFSNEFCLLKFYLIDKM